MKRCIPVDYLVPTEWSSVWCVAMEWPIGEAHRVIWDPLHDCARIEWQWTLADLGKGHECCLPRRSSWTQFGFFIFLWGGGVKGLIVNRSNLVVVCGRSSLKWTLFLDFPSVCASSPDGTVSFRSCNWISNLCQKHGINFFFKTRYKCLMIVIQINCLISTNIIDFVIVLFVVWFHGPSQALPKGGLGGNMIL